MQSSPYFYLRVFKNLMKNVKKVFCNVGKWPTSIVSKFAAHQSPRGSTQTGYRIELRLQIACRIFLRCIESCRCWWKQLIFSSINNESSQLFIVLIPSAFISFWDFSKAFIGATRVKVIGRLFGECVKLRASRFALASMQIWLRDRVAIEVLSQVCLCVVSLFMDNYGWPFFCFTESVFYFLILNQM